jgi:hypothetical protein
MTVMAIDKWATNAALIADVASLGYLSDDLLILDATYGLQPAGRRQVHARRNSSTLLVFQKEKA